MVSFFVRVRPGASFGYTYGGRPCTWRKDVQHMSDCALEDSCHRMQVQADTFVAIASYTKDDFELLGFTLKGDHLQRTGARRRSSSGFQAIRKGQM